MLDIKYIVADGH